MTCYYTWKVVFAQAGSAALDSNGKSQAKGLLTDVSVCDQFVAVCLLSVRNSLLTNCHWLIQCVFKIWHSQVAWRNLDTQVPICRCSSSVKSCISTPGQWNHCRHCHHHHYSSGSSVSSAGFRTQESGPSLTIIIIIDHWSSSINFHSMVHGTMVPTTYLSKGASSHAICLLNKH